MYTKFISQKIQEKLKAKERALGWKSRNANTEFKDGTLMPKDIMSRTVFVRMCSNKSEVPNIVMGVNDDQFDSAKYNVFSTIYEISPFLLFSKHIVIAPLFFAMSK